LAAVARESAVMLACSWARRRSQYAASALASARNTCRRYSWNATDEASAARRIFAVVASMPPPLSNGCVALMPTKVSYCRPTNARELVSEAPMLLLRSRSA